MSYTFDRRLLLKTIIDGAAAGVSEVALSLQTEIRTMLDNQGSGAFSKPARKRTFVATRLQRTGGRLVAGSRVAKFRTRSTGRSGRGYRRSVIGQPPAKQWGTLLGSWQTRLGKPRRFGDRVVLTVGQKANIAPYARALEYGYPPNNLGPRPYVRPSVRAVFPRAMPTIERRIADALWMLGAGGMP